MGIMENQRVLIEENDIKIERQRASLEEKDVEIKRLIQSYKVNKTAIQSFSVPDKHPKVRFTWGFYFFTFCIVCMVWNCPLGKKNGKCTYTYADGSVYVGEYKDDKM